MKKITIIGADEISQVRTFRVGKGKYDLVIEGPEEMSVSDGYHTIEELYDHRIAIYISLCRMAQYAHLLELSNNPFTPPRKVWRSKLHSDGSSFDGWFILGIGEEKNQQITYHLPLEKWSDTEFAETLEKAPEWDGHTSSDVIGRLGLL